MKHTLFNWILFSTAAAWGGEQMTVAICNIGDLPTRAIEHAEAEAAYVFQTMGVEIHWTRCGSELDAQNTGNAYRILSFGCGSAVKSKRLAPSLSSPWGAPS